MENVLLQELSTVSPKLCALATSTTTGVPHAAFMAFAILDNGYILLNTDIRTKKVANIKENTHVALVIGMDTTKKNYQVQGDASIVIEEDIAHKTYKEIFYTQNPHLEAYKEIPNHIFIRILPTWIRETDYSIKPPLIQEFKLH